MSESFWSELVSVIPEIAWVAFATLVFLTLRKPIIRRFLDRPRESKEAVAGREGEKGNIRRWDHAAEFLLGGRILWVDDNALGNSELIKLFRSAGMTVDAVTSTEDAIAYVGQGGYDIILSDIKRNGDPQAGIKMLRELERHQILTPVVIYAMAFDPELGVDHRIFGGTNDPREVVHYVIDLMERVRMSLG
ncbi:MULTISPECIES: response regulator [unclassified Streptomyces]|uniref:response regulator n=1 Tax=unclassified Streptomyces TaxID=2593676 RepID=UPI00382197C3